MKLCSKCKDVLDNQSTEAGSYCRACHNTYNKWHYKKNPRCRQKADKSNRAKIRQRIIEAKDKPCADCGHKYPWYVMDFDHVRGEKKIALSIAARTHLSRVKLDAEIAKCDVVCSNCHRIRTFQYVPLVK